MQAARPRLAAGETVILELDDGRYELAQPLIFGPADSGIRLRARAGAHPVLSGGTRLTGWQRASNDPRRWSVQLPEVASGRWYFRQLMIDGRRWQRARQPNAGYFQTTAALGKGTPITLPFRSGDLTADHVRSGVELTLLIKWTDLHLPIRRVDEAQHTAALPGGPRSEWMDEPDARYWIENAASGLDQPGEWMLDPVTGTATLIGGPDFDPNRALVIAPRLTTLLEWVGTNSGSGNVRDVQLNGLTFSDTDYELPVDGLISPQAAVPIRGALRADFARNCQIENCRFLNLGGYGLELRRGCQQWRVVGNEFAELGAGGLRLGEPGGTEDPSTATHTTEFTDNHLHALGRVFPAACGVLVFRSATNHIAHNHIHDLYYTGISVGWEWGYHANACRANVIEFNHVHDLGQGRLSDMGGIYTLGPQPGTVIRNNVFHDIQSYRYGGWGLYTDEGSTGILVENNVVYRCKDAGFHQHYGRDNVVRNNLLVDNQNHAIMRTRSEAHRSFWFTRNVVVNRSGTLLGSNWSGTTNQFVTDQNLWFDPRLGNRAGDYRFDGKSFTEWQALGHDRNSEIGDPQLQDFDRPELGLRPGSPAFRLGFQQIDTQRVGPRPPEQRR